MEKVAALMQVANNITKQYRDLTNKEKEEIKKELMTLGETIKYHLQGTGLPSGFIEELVNNISEQSDMLLNKALQQNRNAQNEDISNQMEDMMKSPHETTERINNLKRKYGIEDEQEAKYKQDVDGVFNRVLGAYEKKFGNISSVLIKEALENVRIAVNNTKETIHETHGGYNMALVNIVNEEIEKASLRMEDKSQEKNCNEKTENNDMFSHLKKETYPPEDVGDNYSNLGSQETPDLSRNDYIV